MQTAPLAIITRTAKVLIGMAIFAAVISSSCTPMLVAIASRSFARRPKSCECLSSETKINAISADSYKTNALSNTSLSTTLPGVDDLPRSDYAVGFLFSCLPAKT